MAEVTKEELAEALKQMIEEFWGTEASPSSPSVIMAAGSILSRLDAEQNGGGVRAALLREAREQAANHPSKDARHFAASVAEYLDGGGQ